jgi:hypothetical protein
MKRFKKIRPPADNAPLAPARAGRAWPKRARRRFARDDARRKVLAAGILRVPRENKLGKEAL